MSDKRISIIEICKRKNEEGFEDIKNFVQAERDSQTLLFESLVGKRKGNKGYYWDVKFRNVNSFLYDDSIFLRFINTWNPSIHFVDKLCEKYEVNCTLTHHDFDDDFMGYYKVNEKGEFQDEHDYYTGMYLYERESFWSEFECDNPDVIDCLNEDFINTVRPYVEEKDIRELGYWMTRY